VFRVGYGLDGVSEIEIARVANCLGTETDATGDPEMFLWTKKVKFEVHIQKVVN
jgi:hypothetical protein